MFEAVQFIEVHGMVDPEETVLGSSKDEMAMVTLARRAREEFMEGGRVEYAWWVVRREGARLAHFIADSKSEKEFVLDLTSGQLVEV